MKSRITYSVNGEFGIEGIDLTKLPAKVYSAVAKLKDYENTGLSPDEVERFKYDGYGKTRNVDKVRTMDIEELAFNLMCPYQFEEGAKIPESCAQVGGNKGCNDCVKEWLLREAD